MSSTEKILLNEVRSALNEAGILSGETICVAYSGGPDSTALLHLFVRLGGEYGYRLTAVHVDHGIRSREEREGELRHVLRTAAWTGVPLFLRFLPQGFLEGETGDRGGLEAAARIRRYEFLERVRQVVGARFVALAHTADDRVETLVMRIFQGSGPEGLTGMRQVDTPLLRPLLNISKETILAYLEEMKLPFSRDTTNDSLDYLRNAVRHELLPSAVKIFPALNRSLEYFAEKMRAAVEALEVHAPPEPEFLQEGNAARYDHELFFRLPLYYRMSLVYKLYNRWYPERRDRLPYAFLRGLCGGPSEDQRHLYGSGHGVRMEKKGRELFWERAVVPFIKKSYLRVVKSGIFRIGNSLRYRVFSEDQWPAAGFPQTPGSVLVVTGKDFLPCVVRSCRRGDFIPLPSGTRRLCDLWKSLNVPSEEERECVVVEDRRGVLAAVQYNTGITVLTGVHAMEPVHGGIKFRIDFGAGCFPPEENSRNSPE
jgi:tRNA(Ile)-lysidine synthase